MLARGGEIPPHEIFSQSKIIGKATQKGNAGQKPEARNSLPNKN
jgi:hypothetical protein